ncbi:MAG: hypothetical protein AB1515_05890 [Nitrospirota bacterium]
MNVMHKLTMHCRKSVVGLLGGIVLLAGWSGIASADHFPAEVVSMTKHNLSENSNIQFGAGGTTLGSSEVCVYCHTPHGAGYGDQLQFGMAPLWNRRINLSTNYTVYSDASQASPHFEASSVSTLGGAIKGVSLACLSCHDGSIAFDALINLQGSGGYQAANETQGAGPGDTTVSTLLFGAFGAEGSTVSGRTFNEAPRSTAAAGNPFGGSLFSNDTLFGSGTEPFPNLTQDLRDDHPISFRIPDDTGADPDLQFSELKYSSVADANSKILYLRRNAVYPVDKRDRLRAYTSAGGTVTSGQVTNAYIECASCHNPHTPRTLFLRLPSGVLDTGAFGTSGTGLPSGGNVSAALAVSTNPTWWSHAPNQASAICVSCHQK